MSGSDATRSTLHHSARLRRGREAHAAPWPGAPMQLTDGAILAVTVLVGVSQGADSHLGWRAELHWSFCTFFVLIYVAAEMRVWNGLNERVFAASTVVILALVVVLARMFKHACLHAADAHERAFNDSSGFSYVVFASYVLTLSSSADIGVGHAAVLLACCSFGVAVLSYVVYELREVLRPYEWKLYDVKRRFLRWVRRDDARYTGDTVSRSM